jgi:hypothetical protein
MIRIVISQHAVNRYRERFSCIKPDRSIVDKLCGLWHRGDTLYRDGPAVMMEFLAHGSIAEWRHCRGVIMVVSHGVMVTVVRRNKNHKPMFKRKHRSKR